MYRKALYSRQRIQNSALLRKASCGYACVKETCKIVIIVRETIENLGLIAYLNFKSAILKKILYELLDIYVDNWMFGFLY